MSLLVKVDKKGRVVIPRPLREEVGLGRVAKIKVEGGKIVIEPVENPLKRLQENVSVTVADIESELRGLRKLAEEQLRKEASKRWR